MITQDFNPNQYIWNHRRFILLETFIHSYMLSPIMVSLSHCIPTPCRLCECMVVCLVLTKMRMGSGYLSGRPSQLPGLQCHYVQSILHKSCHFSLCSHPVLHHPAYAYIPFSMCLFLHAAIVSAFYNSTLLLLLLYPYHPIPLIPFSHSSFVFLCISPNHSSSLSNTSHGVVMKRLSLKSLTNHTLFCPCALDNVMYMLNGVRCPLNGIPMSTHKCSII